MPTSSKELRMMVQGLAAQCGRIEATLGGFQRQNEQQLDDALTALDGTESGTDQRVHHALSEARASIIAARKEMDALASRLHAYARAI